MRCNIWIDLAAQQVEAPERRDSPASKRWISPANQTEADALFNRLSIATESDAALSLSLGTKLVQAGQFSQAEAFLANALAANPTSFSLQYQLGAVASRAGDNERARDILERALRQQPQNVDVLYALAFVYSALKQPEQAVRLLSQAAKAAPQRADVQKLLAVTTGDLLAYEDSVAAWDRYIALAPNDDTGRRERGFAKSNMKQAEGIADLEWYAGRHPDDAIGLFELGVGQSVSDPDKGLATLDRAITLKPDFTDARSARGALNYQQGKAEVALADLEFAAEKLPDSAPVLDRLGQTYLLLDRVQDAIRVLRKAAALAPGDSKTQLHMANALAQAGETTESRIFMNRYRELGGNGCGSGARRDGFFEPDAGTAARGLSGARGERNGRSPGRRFSSGGVSEGADRRWTDGSGFGYSAEDCGDEAGRDSADRCRAGDAVGPAIWGCEGIAGGGARGGSGGRAGSRSGDCCFPCGWAGGWNLAGWITFRQAARGGDYYVARAQMLDAEKKPDDAVAAAALAVKTEPERADLYWQATAMMVKNRRADEALRLMDQGGFGVGAECAGCGHSRDGAGAGRKNE